MWPIILKVGPVTLRSYGLTIALGFLVVLYLVQRDARKLGVDSRVINDAAFWVLLSGLLGARVVHILMYPESYSWRDPIGWVAVWRGGLVFQGGPPAAIIVCYLYLRKKGLDPWRVADISIPYAPIGHALGRVGCFLNGCCYGARTNLPWGCRFPPGSDAHASHYGELAQDVADWSFPVHPTQLYEAAALAAIAFLLLSLRKKWRPFDGFTMPVYFILYSTWRFFIEFIRGDRNPRHFGIFTDQQVFCIGFALAGIILFVALRTWHSRKGSTRDTPGR